MGGEKEILTRHASAFEGLGHHSSGLALYLSCLPEHLAQRLHVTTIHHVSVPSANKEAGLPGQGGRAEGGKATRTLTRRPRSASDRPPHSAPGGSCRCAPGGSRQRWPRGYPDCSRPQRPVPPTRSLLRTRHLPGGRTLGSCSKPRKGEEPREHGHLREEPRWRARGAALITRSLTLPSSSGKL